MDAIMPSVYTVIEQSSQWVLGKSESYFFFKYLKKKKNVFKKKIVQKI